jgi:hypothetical protein
MNLATLELRAWYNREITHVNGCDRRSKQSSGRADEFLYSISIDEFGWVSKPVGPIIAAAQDGQVEENKEVTE